ncbi:M81 family metallopeptidase [Bradyrhizobium australiense]|uniref:Microcystin LR degradation protein MlrC N-terminal domain-containing protein n=1 Tax=Bradyrhizobium australiense TaxID=2721161 RepID=A0A7Y4GZ95_9BRAD|nr:M81 family metallopeptidase [Bradyrhizobium australiense]NOJ44606.1 hypothetical protein [Bradyrhizobium australiense]
MQFNLHRGLLHKYLTFPRAVVGPNCVIGVEFDPHSHLTLKHVKLADVIVLYKEYRHTDTVACAEDLPDMGIKTLLNMKPVMSLYDCRQIQIYRTTLPLNAQLRGSDQGI